LETTEPETGGIMGAINSMAGLLPFSDPIVAASIFLLITFIAKTIITLGRDGLMAYSSAKVLYNVKNQIIERYSGAQYPFFLDSKQGNLIYNSQIAPHRLSLLLLRVAIFFSHFLRIIAITIVLALVSLPAMLSITALGLTYLVVIHYISNRVSYSLGKGRADAYAEQTVIANEYFSGIRHIIAYRSAKKLAGQTPPA
jgi:ABC-type multidrug transport system fused ATPase/permease subunit